MRTALRQRSAQAAGPDEGVPARRPTRLLLAVTGCIQARVIPRLVCRLRAGGRRRVIVAATESALRFFDREEVEKTTGERVYVHHHDGTRRFPVPHINLSSWADGMIVYPASANSIAKCAHGLCDTLVTTLVLAARCPVYFGPSMNEAMLENPILQANLRRLEEAGHRRVPTRKGWVYKHATRETVRTPHCTEGAIASVAADIDRARQRSSSFHGMT